MDLSDLSMCQVHTIFRVRVRMYTCYQEGTSRWDPMRFSTTAQDPSLPMGGVLVNLTCEWQQLWAATHVATSTRPRGAEHPDPMARVRERPLAPRVHQTAHV